MSSRWMINRAGSLVGLALLVGAFGSATPAAAQIAPQKKPAASSEMKVKINKEGKKGTAGGDVALPCAIDQDSVIRAVSAARQEEALNQQAAVARQRAFDSTEAAATLDRAMAEMRRAAAAERERMRLDSIAAAEQAELARKRHLARGFYVGLGGGASTPMQTLRNGYAGGWNTTIPLGWDADDAPWGIRSDFAIDHLNGTRLQDASTTTTAMSGDITVYSLNVDLKLRAHAPGGSTRSHVYALAGIGAHRVAEGVYGTSGPNAGQNLGFADAKTNFGWNAGAGVAFAWGPTELFVESRFVRVSSDLGYLPNNGVGSSASFTPIVIGLQWF